MLTRFENRNAAGCQAFRGVNQIYICRFSRWVRKCYDYGSGWTARFWRKRYVLLSVRCFNVSHTKQSQPYRSFLPMRRKERQHDTWTLRQLRHSSQASLRRLFRCLSLSILLACWVSWISSGSYRLCLAFHLESTACLEWHGESRRCGSPIIQTGCIYLWDQLVTTQ